MASSVDASELDEARDSLIRLASNLRSSAGDIGDDITPKLEKRIVSQINRMGLRGDSENGVQLKDSFISGKTGSLYSGGEWLVTSRARHAMPLEVGADPHRIEPNQKDLLSWVPEDPSAWPRKDGKGNPTTWYDPDAGRVFSLGVDHPGNKAYNYVFHAQVEWNNRVVKPKIRRETANAIRRSGYRRSR